MISTLIVYIEHTDTSMWLVTLQLVEEYTADQSIATTTGAIAQDDADAAVAASASTATATAIDDTRVFYSTKDRDAFMKQIIIGERIQPQGTNTPGYDGTRTSASRTIKHRVVQGYTVQRIQFASSPLLSPSPTSSPSTLTATIGGSNRITKNNNDNDDDNNSMIKKPTNMCSRTDNTIHNSKNRNNTYENNKTSTCSSKRILSKEEYEPLVQRYELFRRVVEHEDRILNQRMVWILLAQDFLMAAFITTVFTSLTTTAAATVIHTNESQQQQHHTQLLFICAAIGILSVVVTLPALIASGKNIEVQQTVYFLGMESDELCRILHGHDRDYQKFDRNEPHEEDLRRLYQSKHGSLREVMTASAAITTRTATATATHNTNNNYTSHFFPNTSYRSKYKVQILTTVYLLSFVQIAGWCCFLVALVQNIQK